MRHRHGSGIHSHAGGDQPHSHAGQGAQAARPLPQTDQGGRRFADALARGYEFIRHSRPSSRPGYAVQGAWGGTTDWPNPSAPGYLRFYAANIGASGGSGGAATVALTADATTFGGAAAVAFVQVKDAWGTVLLTGSGVGMLGIVPWFSQQVGLFGGAYMSAWPSYSAPAVGAGASGNFSFPFRIPFEFGQGGMGSLAIGDASLQPSIHWQWAAQAAFYSTPPATTVPQPYLTVDEHFWSVPSGEHQHLRPPELGTTLQWWELTASTPVTSAASQRIQFPRMAGEIAAIILVARDSTGARTNSIFPPGVANGGTGNINTNNRIRLYMDGQPVRDESIDQRLDQMFLDLGGASLSGNVSAFPNRPAGVVAYTFKNNGGNVGLGLFDGANPLTYARTTPGTLIEVECTPWGTFGNSPATITAIVGTIVPKGKDGRSQHGQAGGGNHQGAGQYAA